MVNNVGDNAYFYCTSCGAEYLGEQVGEVPYSRQTADAEHGLCPLCGEDSQVDYDNEG